MAALMTPMNDYILLMHDDCRGRVNPDDWGSYFAQLRDLGAFQGGSAIGKGITMRKDDDPQPVTNHVTGYIRLRAASMQNAQALVAGNPVFEAGGTVEVRDLPRE